LHRHTPHAPSSFHQFCLSSAPRMARAPILCRVCRHRFCTSKQQTAVALDSVGQQHVLSRHPHKHALFFFFTHCFFFPSPSPTEPTNPLLALSLRAETGWSWFFHSGGCWSDVRREPPAPPAWSLNGRPRESRPVHFSRAVPLLTRLFRFFPSPSSVELSPAFFWISKKKAAAIFLTQRPLPVSWLPEPRGVGHDEVDQASVPRSRPAGGSVNNQFCSMNVTYHFGGGRNVQQPRFSSALRATWRHLFLPTRSASAFWCDNAIGSVGRA